MTSERKRAALSNRLSDERDEIVRLERLLKAARTRREVLTAKAVRLGMSSRQIAAVAGFSSPAACAAARRGELVCQGSEDSNGGGL